MPAIVRRLRAGAELVLSGILVERGQMVLDRMRGLGFEERARRTSGDWVAFRVGAS
jgi:ribosomal protein L11 methylase PrmA